jgi:hypothetical protein
MIVNTFAFLATEGAGAQIPIVRERDRRKSVETKSYFLNKLSNAARASDALRDVCIAVVSIDRPDPLEWLPLGTASRATVTAGAKEAHSFAWSFTGIRTSIGFVH